MRVRQDPKLAVAMLEHWLATDSRTIGRDWMLLERAELVVKPGVEEAFAAAMTTEGARMLLSVEGVKSVDLGRGVENPDKFMLLVEWESMEAHGKFKTHPIYPDFGKLMGTYLQTGAMEHFEMGETIR
jgi:heme-degrading monooxygenase HmoA